jgi:hypothetical protein
LSLSSPFNPKIIATSLRIANVNELHIAPCEQSVYHLFSVSVLDIFFAEQNPFCSVRRERQPMASEIERKTCVIGEPRTGLSVDEDRPRQRKRLNAVKGIIGKENPAFFPDLKVAQAMAAGAIRLPLQHKRDARTPVSA